MRCRSLNVCSTGDAMPNTLIEIRRPITREQELALIEAVHAGLREAFKIPEWDRTVRLVVHEPHRFACSPRLQQPELYTLVTIDCFAGRSIEAKRALYKAIVQRLAALGIPADHSKILLRDSAMENWGIRGGQAACDIDVGFKVDV
jgi:phenylpyruvate tautomerase PptA (4-oxalocrotonate tautomerase family)